MVSQALNGKVILTWENFHQALNIEIGQRVVILGIMKPLNFIPN